MPRHSINKKEKRNINGNRPLVGGILLILSGVLILWVPLSMAPIAMMPGSFSILGLVFGGMVVLLGVLALSLPAYSQLIGVLSIFFACLSLIGALGGFLIGTILGIVGGAHCFAWIKEPAQEHDPLQGKQRTAS